MGSRRPAMSPEERQNGLIKMAYDESERLIREGKASSQLLTHFLKLEAEKEKSKTELLILKEQKALITAKTENLKSQQNQEQLYKDAIAATLRYQGRDEMYGDDDEL